MDKQLVARAPVSELANLPSVERLLQSDALRLLVNGFGRNEVLLATRSVLHRVREQLIAGKLVEVPSDQLFCEQIQAHIEQRAKPKTKTVINLTGTVLHTNLGRAVMPPEVVEAMALAAAQPCALEYDLGEGKRGDRDELVEELLCELTGAEAATVVNNNAAAVFLLLHALSNKKEVIVSRGELIEIGGSFRIPDIMKRAGAKLVEVGTTNRTHDHDFQEAITSKTSMLMKIHTSNYAIQGFTKAVPEEVLASISHAHQLPFVVDLGSGTLVDMTQYGLPAEPTPRAAIAAGADLVTFSGDKLLGGPQAGILVGKKELIAKIKKNPLKRVLRVGKVTLAGLEAVLRLYRDPDNLPKRLTVLQLLTRPRNEMQSQALRLIPHLIDALSTHQLSIKTLDVSSQIGSGSLPIERLPSVALAIEAIDKRSEKHVVKLEKLLRASDIPVIGRFQEKALIFDLRCLSEQQEPLLARILTESIARLPK